MKVGDNIICKSKFSTIDIGDILIIEQIYLDGALRIKNDLFTILKSAFHNYFLTISEWRDIQMESILE